MTQWTINDIPDQTGRTAVVTGANSGVGRATALELAKHGARVIAAGRSADSGRKAVEDIRRQAPRSDVEWATLDLADLRSVRAFAEQCAERHDTLDLLINNAAAAYVPYGKTADGFEITFGTNHLGHFALTGLLLPLLLDRPGARIVTVTSRVHMWANAQLDFDDLQFERNYKRSTAYARSKLANMLFVQELHRRLTAAGQPVRSIATDPGVTATNLGPRFPGHTILRRLLVLVAHPPVAGAAPSLYAATAPDAKGGEWYLPHGGLAPLRLRTRREEPGTPVTRQGAPWAYDQDAARRLWEISETLTGVSFQVGSARP